MIALGRSGVPGVDRLALAIVHAGRFLAVEASRRLHDVALAVDLVDRGLDRLVIRASVDRGPARDAKHQQDRGNRALERVTHHKTPELHASATTYRVTVTKRSTAEDFSVYLPRSRKPAGHGA